jgi:hypothetical protein
VVGVVAAVNGSNAASPILIIGGVGAMGWGAQHLNTAVAALSRSLWYYNRDVARHGAAAPTVGRVDPVK